MSNPNQSKSQSRGGDHTEPKASAPETRTVELAGTPDNCARWVKKYRPDWKVISILPDPDNQAGSIATLACTDEPAMRVWENGKVVRTISTDEPAAAPAGTVAVATAPQPAKAAHTLRTATENGMAGVYQAGKINKLQAELERVKASEARLLAAAKSLTAGRNCNLKRERYQAWQDLLAAIARAEKGAKP